MNEINSKGLKLYIFNEKSTDTLAIRVNDFFTRYNVEIISIQWQVITNVGFVIFLFYREKEK